MNTVSRGIRNAFRNKIRTFSIVVILGLSVGMALSMLISRQAVMNKIATIKGSVGNTITISPAGVRGFQGGGNALTETDMTLVKNMAHVQSLAESLNDRLTTSSTNLVSAVDAGSLGRRFAGNSGEPGSLGDMPQSFGGADNNAFASFTPPVTLLGTTSPTDLSSTQGGGTFTLKSGAIFASGSDSDVALLGSSLATKNSLKVGSTFTAYGSTVKVVGIFDAGNTFSNNQVIMPLKTVQMLSGQPGAVTNATAVVDSISNVDSVASSISKALGDKADVTSDESRAKSSVAPLENIQTIALYSLIGAIIAGGAIILLTMIMIVRECRREIGVMKAIGASNFSIMTQFSAEAVTFTAIGAVLGILIGVVAGNPITKLLVNNATSSPTGQQVIGGVMGRRGGFGGQTFGNFSHSLGNISASVGWSVVLYGLLVAVLIAIVGSVLTSFFIARIRPAEVMRSE